MMAKRGSPTPLVYRQEVRLSSLVVSFSHSFFTIFIFSNNALIWLNKFPEVIQVPSLHVDEGAWANIGDRFRNVKFAAVM